MIRNPQFGEAARSAIRDLLLASCILCLASACASQPMTVTREPVTLRLIAADSCASLVEDIAQAYEENRPWVTVEFDAFDNAEAEEILREGGAHMALLSWLEPSAEEDAEEEVLWSQSFSRDGIAVVVHPDSPLTEVDLTTLQEIFRGRLQERDGTVLEVVVREEGSGTRIAFERIVMGDESPTVSAVVMPSSEAVIEHVAGTPGAIGYVSTLRLDDRVRALPVEGVYPTQEAVSAGEYPLSRPLYLAAITEPVDENREFAQWLLARGVGLVDW